MRLDSISRPRPSGWRGIAAAAVIAFAPGHVGHADPPAPATKPTYTVGDWWQYTGRRMPWGAKCFTDLTLFASDSSSLFSSRAQPSRPQQ